MARTRSRRSINSQDDSKRIEPISGSDNLRDGMAASTRRLNTRAA
jgi:hypothetical protein